MEIIPAILEQDFKEIAKKIASVEGLASWVQIDVADGLFAPVYTWENWEDLRQVEGEVKIEVHLMMEQPEQYVQDWMQVADRVIIHPEATEHLDEIIKLFENSPSKLGLALLLETPPEKFEAYVGKADLVQLMGINKIGFQGEVLDEGVVEKIKLLRQKFPNAKISVDGGVTLENAERLAEAGADNLVIGSAIWKSADPAAALQEFKLKANALS